MAASEVEICNLALDAVGTRSTIASLTESSAEARACSRQYRAARDSVLAAAHWNFARKQVALAVLKDGTVTPSQNVPTPWTYEYAYPSDCISARYLMPSVMDTLSQTRVLANEMSRFIVSSDVDSFNAPNKVILTNLDQAILVYTMRLEDPSLYDEQFTTAFSYFLGAKLALALTGDKALARGLFATADQMTREARAGNGNEGGPTLIDITPDWISARGFDADAGFPYSPYILPPVNLSFVA